MRIQRIVSKPLFVLAAALALAACGEPGNPPAAACADVSCGEGQCVERDGQAACECPLGYHADGLACISDDPCAPNPCTEAHRTVCGVDGASAVCGCDPGYVLAGVACVPEPVSCEGQHAAGDEFEPDECPGQARDIGTAGGQLEAHTVFPAADADWFTIASEPGRIYQATVEGDAGFALSVALFGPLEEGQDGPPQLASQTASSSVALAVKATAETLFARVRASTEGLTGGYRISIRDEGLDDHGDDASSATQVGATGTEQSGRWQFTGDKDWLKFDAEAGHAYKLTCSTTGLSNKCAARLLDAAGNVLASDTQVVTILSRPTPVAGAYFIELALSNSGMAGYTWKLEDLGADDHGNDAASATPIDPGDLGKDHTGKWELSGDRDWFKFALTAGRVYRFTCVASGSTCTIRRFDGAGNELGMDAGSLPVLAWKAAASRTEYFEVKRPASNPGTGTYTWKLEDLGLDDHGDDALGATQITAAGTGQNAKWEFHGDADWLKLDAAAGHAYKLTCSTSGLANSCFVKLRDASGAELDSDAGVVALLSWSAAANAPYFLELVHLNNQPADYTWKLEDLGADDHGDDRQTATLVAPADFGADHPGKWELSGDTDWLKFESVAGHVYRFNCVSGVTAPCVARLFDASGTEIDSDSATTATVGMSTQTVATWFVEVTRPVSNPGTGTYSWKLEDLGADDHAGDLAGASLVTATGVETNAQWEFAGDRDWLKFAATANHVYRFNCSVSGAGNQCAFKLYDAAGALVASPPSSSFISHNWKAPASATYYLEYANSSSSRTGPYTWKLTDLGADDHGDDLASATVIAVNATETAGRWNISGDLDLLRFDAPSANDYRITCASRTAGATCALKLRDGAGTLIDSQTATTAALTWRAAAGSRYHVEIGRGTAGTGDYGWTLEDLGP